MPVAALPPAATRTEPAPRAKLFVSYSHRDGIWLEKLKPHLGALARERGFSTEFFDDTQIRPGSRWRERIDDAMASAQVAILLVSKYFLDSEFITGNELPPLLEAAQDARAVVLPVILSPCRYDSHAALSKIQSVNPPSEPLEGMGKVRREALLLKVTNLVDDALRQAAAAAPGPTAGAPAVAVADGAAARPAGPGKGKAARSNPARPAAEPGRSTPATARAAQPAGDDWQQVVVQCRPDGGLQFQTLQDNQRVEGSLQPEQRRLVDSLARRCSDELSPFDAKLAAALFELLVPNDLKPWLFKGKGTLLTLDATGAQYPWEMLQEGLGEAARPFSLQVPMLRNTVSHRFNPHPSTRLQQALVVGDLTLEAPFPPLPGARKEALAVAQLLEQAGFAVQRQIQGTGLDLMASLFSETFQVLHLAGHGAYEVPLEPGTPPVTGFVLDQGLCFTGAEVRQLRVAPELVFLNASHLGRHKVPDAQAEPASQRYAPSLPDQFMAIGSRAIVAPVGSPDDDAAETFATRFYAEMLAGQALGPAVLAARRAAWTHHPLTKSWGYYVCYGDPGFRLVTAAAAPPLPKATSS